jgi:hypothetical protein
MLQEENPVKEFAGKHLEEELDSIPHQEEMLNDPNRTKFVVMDVKSIPEPLKRDGKWAKLVEGHGLILWDSELGGHKPQVIDRSDFYDVIDSNQLTAEDREALKGAGFDMDKVSDFPSVYQTHPEEGVQFIEVIQENRVDRGKLSYIFREENIMAHSSGRPFNLAYTLEGDLIGDATFAQALIRNYIRPEKIEQSDRACQIGFKEDTQAWYGWRKESFETVRFFEKGQQLEADDKLSRMKFDNGLKIPVNFKAVTLNDAKRLAIAWARQNYIDNE